MDDFEELCETAQEAMQEGDYETALKAWQDAYDLLDEAHPQQSVDKAQVALMTALCAIQRGRYAEAIETADEVVEYFDWTVQHESAEGQQALLILTEAYASSGDMEKALATNDRALAALRQNGTADPRVLATTVQKRCDLAERLQDPAQCTQAVEWAFAQFEKLGQGKVNKRTRTDLKFQRAQVLESRAKVWKAVGDKASAEKDLTAAIEAYEAAFGKGDETADDARELLKELRG